MFPEESHTRPTNWGQARWADTQRHAMNWSVIGASDFVIRCVTFGIWDPPTFPFTTGRVLPSIPQTAVDLDYARRELRDGCCNGVYRTVTKNYALGHVRNGCYVSSAFVDWSKPKGRFIINLKLQSTHWEKRSIIMQSLSSFGRNLNHGDHLISFDWKGGYRHFRLNRRMLKWFLFHYEGSYYECIALPFGWTRSPFWFCHLLSPLSRYLRSTLKCRVLQWIDD